jgi:hypothetical protein
LLVRPGQETWRDFIGDGGSADDDVALNGVAVLRAAKLKGFAKAEKHADKFDKDDTLVVIDPITLAVSVRRLQ